MDARDGAQVLLTGATGFLGKVVLHDLLGRRKSLGIAHQAGRYDLDDLPLDQALARGGRGILDLLANRHTQAQ